MKLVDFKCPNCNSSIQIDAGGDTATCSYCGTTFGVDDGSITINVNHSFNFAEEEEEEVQPKKRKTWLWVLGWLLCFPIPLTILMLKSPRTEHLDSKIRIGSVIAGWLLFCVIGFSGMTTSSVSLDIESPDLSYGTDVVVHVSGTDSDGQSVERDVVADIGKSTNTVEDLKAGEYVFSLDPSQLNKTDNDLYKVDNGSQNISYDGKSKLTVHFTVTNDKEAAKAAKEAKKAEEKAAKEAEEAERKAAQEEQKAAQQESKQDNTSSTTQSASRDVVYLSESGDCYHKAGCRTLKDVKIETTVSAAKAQGKKACGVCNPPLE